MAENRFDKWSPLIPKVGEVVEVHIGESTFETKIVTRGVSPDKRTFYIIFFDKRMKLTEMIITPSVSGLGDDPERKPFWQVVREEARKDNIYEPASPFFLDQQPGFVRNPTSSGIPR